MATGIISSPGVGSGINVNQLVSQLLKAQYGPQQQIIKNQSGQLNAELSALGMLSGKVSAIGTTLTALTHLTPGYAASASNPAVLGVSTQGGATPGRYAIHVTQLAAAESLASKSFSAATATVGTGTLTFQFGSYASGSFVAQSGSTTTQVTIDSSNNTLQGVAGAINQAHFGVSATIINTGSGYKLALTSRTGTDHALNITTAASALSAFTYTGGSTTTGALTQTTPAANAALTLNGISISAQGNTITNVVQGVTFNLNSTGTSSVSVSTDTGTAVSAVQSFVNAYNQYVASFNQYDSYNAKTRQAGPLLGSATLLTLNSQLQNGLVQNITGAPANYNTLMALGITASGNGTLKFDSGQLTSALNGNYSGILTTLQGVGKQLGSVVSPMTGINGILTAKTDTINKELTQLQTRLSTLGTQMKQQQSMLLQQYSTMDTLVANYKNTSAYLTVQLASLLPAGYSSGSSSKIGG